jgi:hypothetical protein
VHEVFPGDEERTIFTDQVYGIKSSRTAEMTKATVMGVMYKYPTPTGRSRTRSLLIEVLDVGHHTQTLTLLFLSALALDHTTGFPLINVLSE